MQSLVNDLRLATNPVAFAAACGIERLDKWQKQLLTTSATRIILNCARQTGKSTITALMALRVALYEGPALCLVLSPSERQSAEFFRKLVELYRRLPDQAPLLSESETRGRFANGSRIIALPGSSATIRGFSAAKLIAIDEAARVDDELFPSIKPMLVSSKGGRLVLLSTPAARAGSFFDIWTKGGPHWLKIKVTAEQSSVVNREVLEEDRQEMPPWRFKAEYMAEFVDDDATLFPSSLLDQLVRDDIRPLFDLRRAA